MPPRFSVVIPTRDRPRTLERALATCLDQDYDDYEVLVCDNGSGETALPVVRDAASARVRYVKAPRPLAMSDNWELALSEARGDYVLVIGDDDGLLGHALATLHRLVERADTGIVRWNAAFYTWPDVDVPGQGHSLTVPTGRDLWMEDAVTVIDAVVRFEWAYTRLPMMNNAAVHRDRLEELRRRTGRVFQNRYPDVYTGFALAFIAGRYLSTEVPMTVAGSSGVANPFHRGRTAIDADFRTLNDAAGLGHHRWVPDLPIFPEVPVAECFQVAKDALFPDDDRLMLDRQQLLAHCLAALSEAGADAPIECLRASADDAPALRAWLDATIAAGVIASRPPIALRPAPLGWREGVLHLDTEAFGVVDIAGAARRVEQLLHLRDAPVAFVERAAIPPRLRPAPSHDVDVPVLAGPTFSVAIPVRGQAQYLPTALASVAAQAVPVRLAVLDASPDDAVQDVLRCQPALQPAYRYHHADGGQAAAIQEGWDRTESDIVTWLCADDYLFPDACARVAQVFEAEPDVDVVFGHGVHVSRDGAFEMYFPATDPDPENLRGGCTICQPACFVRRRAMQRVHGLDPRLHYTMDWDFWLRLHAAGCRFHFLDETLAAVRVYAETKTRSGGPVRRREIAQLLTQHGAAWPERTRAALGFWKADVFGGARRSSQGRLAEAVDRVVGHGRRVMRRPRPVLRGLEAWTNRVAHACVVELPWQGSEPPVQVSVITDRAVPLMASVAGIEAQLRPAGTRACEFRGQVVSGCAAEAAISMPNRGRITLTLTGDGMPWRLWQCRVR